MFIFTCLQAANMALRGDLAAREAMYAEAKETASNLSTEVSRVSARLAQTQQLLVVVREQKDELQVRAGLGLSPVVIRHQITLAPCGWLRAG